MAYFSLNLKDCHKDCFGCYEPKKKHKCFACKEGLRMVDGICKPVTEPCPPHRFENKLKECQPYCSYYRFPGMNCETCDLTTNKCLTCRGLFKLESGTCTCKNTGGLNITTTDGDQLFCPSEQAKNSEPLCAANDSNNVCTMCSDNSKIALEGECKDKTTNKCPDGQFMKSDYLRRVSYCSPCPEHCLLCSDRFNCDQCASEFINLGDGVCEKIAFPLKF